MIRNGTERTTDDGRRKRPVSRRVASRRDELRRSLLRSSVRPFISARTFASPSKERVPIRARSIGPDRSSVLGVASRDFQPRTVCVRGRRDADDPPIDGPTDDDGPANPETGTRVASHRIEITTHRKEPHNTGCVVSHPLHSFIHSVSSRVRKKKEEEETPRVIEIVPSGQPCGGQSSSPSSRAW
jgi:hypothetical protein